MNFELYYKNKKGSKVSVTPTQHALDRYLERWKLVQSDKDTTDAEILCTLPHYFNLADRLTKLGKHDQERLKKYGKDTMFFRKNHWTFVVQNSQLVTVEISSKNNRHLNKQSTQRH